jgi:hypothetical protein
MALRSVISFVSDKIYDRVINICSRNWLCQQYLKVINIKNNGGSKVFKRTCLCVWQLCVHQTLSNVLNRLCRIPQVSKLLTPSPTLSDSIYRPQFIAQSIILKVWSVLFRTRFRLVTKLGPQLTLRVSKCLIKA